MKKIFLLGILICTMLGNFVACSEPKPEETLNDFISAVSSNDIDNALKYIEPKKAETFELVFDKLQKISNNDKINEVFERTLPFVESQLSPEVISVKKEGNGKATVTISVDMGNKVELYDVFLIQIDKKWYIDSAKKHKDRRN